MTHFPQLYTCKRGSSVAWLLSLLGSSSALAGSNLPVPSLLPLLSLFSFPLSRTFFSRARALSLSLSFPLSLKTNGHILLVLLQTPLPPPNFLPPPHHLSRASVLIPLPSMPMHAQCVCGSMPPAFAVFSATLGKPEEGEEGDFSIRMEKEKEKERERERESVCVCVSREERENEAKKNEEKKKGDRHCCAKKKKSKIPRISSSSTLWGSPPLSSFHPLPLPPTTHRNPSFFLVFACLACFVPRSKIREGK